MGQPSVNIGTFVSAVQRILKDSVVGYSLVIGGDGIAPTKYSSGEARTTANGQAIPFESSTRTAMASVSKFLTAIAAVQLLDGGSNTAGANLDSRMWTALPKSWWSWLRDDALEITYRDLLTHTSGLPPDGTPNVPGADYFSLKNLMTTEAIALGPRGKPPKYCGVGFALFRLLLPKLAGFVSPHDDLSIPEEDIARGYAAAYERVIRQGVFGPLGVVGALTSTPRDDTHAWSYYYPGQSSGYDWSQWQYPGQVSPGNGQPLWAGPGCWWVSIDEFTALLDSINKVDGKVLSSSQWQHMQGIGVPSGYENLGLGIDTLAHPANNQYRWVEKNGGGPGGDSTGSGTYSTSVAFFGSMEPGNGSNGPLYAALFTNSDIGAGWLSDNRWYWCSKCATLAYGQNSPICPATGAAHASGGQYVLSSSQKPEGQGDWRRCGKCNALFSAISTAQPSKCPADGQRHEATVDPPIILSQTGKSTMEFQNDWRWCKNCGVLAYSNGNASNGRCAAGGPHQFILSDSNYVLQGFIGADTVLAEAFLESIMLMEGTEVNSSEQASLRQVQFRE